MKTKKDSDMRLLVSLFIAMLSLIGIIVVLNLLLREENDGYQLLFDLGDDLLSAIVIGLFVGLITQIITSKLFSVEVNMKK